MPENSSMALMGTTAIVEEKDEKDAIDLMEYFIVQYTDNGSSPQVTTQRQVVVVVVPVEIYQQASWYLADGDRVPTVTGIEDG